MDNRQPDPRIAVMVRLGVPVDAAADILFLQDRRENARPFAKATASDFDALTTDEIGQICVDDPDYNRRRAAVTAIYRRGLTDGASLHAAAFPQARA